MSDWEPRQTALKNDTSILVTREGGYDGPYWVIYWNGDFWESADSGREIGPDCWTHWMPIQEPPGIPNERTTPGET